MLEVQHHSELAFSLSPAGSWDNTWEMYGLPWRMQMYSDRRKWEDHLVNEWVIIAHPIKNVVGGQKLD